MNRKTLIIIAFTALVGGFLGSLVPLYPAQANPVRNAIFNGAGLFDDFYNQYIKPLILPQSLPVNGGSEVKAPLFELPPKSASQPIYSPTIDYEQAVVKAVENASPAVISIIISKNLPVIEQCPYDPFGNLPPEFQQFFGQNFQFSQPCEKGTKLQEIGGGSGFIVSADGLIVTNKHVVFDEKAEYTVLTNDGKKYSAQVLARDPVNDLALIKIAANNLPIIRLGDSSSIKLGQTAIAIGNALGEFRNTVSVGVISGLSRSIVASGAGLSEKIEGLIQTDAAINEGNSGGPLLNLKGEVVGINVAMVSGAQSIGFAIPTNQVRKAIESVQKVGRIVNPYLGVRYILITPELADQEKLAVQYGALVKSSAEGPAVIPGSPAEKSGIKAGDIILELGGEKITTDNSLAQIIQKYNVGDVVNLKILRNGKEMIISVKLEERPKI